MHSVPEEIPDFARAIVTTRTMRSRAHEISGIATSQLDFVLTRPICLRRCNPVRKPSLDLNAAMKQAT